jgi:hypothetical protein
MKEIKSVEIKLKHNNTIFEMIKLSVHLLNEQFENGLSELRLNPNYSIYKVKPSKKNGKPDLDLPSKELF